MPREEKIFPNKLIEFGLKVYKRGYYDKWQKGYFIDLEKACMNSIFYYLVIIEEF